FLIHPEYTQTDNLVDVNKDFSEEIKGDNLGITEAALNNEERVISYAELSNGHTLLISSTKNDIYSDVDQLTKVICFVLFGIIIIAVMIAFLLGNKITKPIHTLIADMKKVKEGDFTIQTTIKNKDEIGEIGKN